MRGLVEFFGILFGVPTIVSLIQHAFQFPLDELLMALLVQYRALVAPVLSVIQAPLAWLLGLVNMDLPPWIHDLHTLSFIGASFGYKAMQKDPEPNSEGFWTYLSSLAWGATFLGLVFIVMLFHAMVFGRRSLDKDRHAMFDAGWITVAGVSVFYAANHAMLKQLIPWLA